MVYPITYPATFSIFLDFQIEFLPNLLLLQSLAHGSPSTGATSLPTQTLANPQTPFLCSWFDTFYRSTWLLYCPLLVASIIRYLHWYPGEFGTDFGSPPLASLCTGPLYRGILSLVFYYVELSILKISLSYSMKVVSACYSLILRLRGLALNKQLDL